MPRRAYLSTPQRGWPTRSFQRNQNQEKERMNENGKGDLPRWWRQNELCLQKTKTGEPTVPPKRPENSTIKGEDGLWRRQRKKKKEHSRKKRFSRKIIRKFRQKENIEGKINTASRYPVKATMAHTRIQHESNFASFEGWNSHSRLQFLSLIGPCITS